MLRFKSVSKDVVGALLLVAIGIGVLALGIGYHIGTLNRMGAGFIPVVLGVLMVGVGIALGLTARTAGSETASTHPPADHGKQRGVDIRAWACILGGVVAFVVLGRWGGLLPATFASVVVAAMGDRQNTWRGAMTLGVVLTVFCLVVFHYGLSLQLPLFQWE